MILLWFYVKATSPKVSEEFKNGECTEKVKIQLNRFIMLQVEMWRKDILLWLNKLSNIIIDNAMDIILQISTAILPLHFMYIFVWKPKTQRI